jgi:D-alanyl-lipoteichoic acid acyltransferase DltB (MBOAT superfamily)
MLFNSIIFLIFLPLVFIGYWVLKPKHRSLLLLLASYYFYFSYNPWFLLLLIATSGIDYYLARFISNSDDLNYKKIALAFSLISNIGVLFVFKYFVFFYNSVGSIFSFEFSVLNSLIIPAGLSFYTFQSISYTIDVYRGKYKATDSLQEFLLFVSFFPHMVAGPIMRHNDLMPQLKVRHYFKGINWEAFAKLTIWGFFKKMVIADNISKIVTPIFNDVSHFSGSTLLVAGFLFVIQVYADFSGYSDIATGVAKLFGINLSLNWKRPLLSKSLHQFWTRWHISLTTWFREYLYIGLGGNRKSYMRWLMNIFIVFLISGLWHGATFTVILWGILHGLFYILEILLMRKFPNVKVNPLIGWVYLILIHTLTLTVFRALSLKDAGIIFNKMIFDFNLSSCFGELNQIADTSFIAICLFVCLILFLKEINEEFHILQKINGYSIFYKPAFYILVLVGIFILGNFNANQFIYFQF